MSRRTTSSSERSELDEIERSLKTSTYLNDDFWENIHHGIKPQQAHIPNYKQLTKGEKLSIAAGGSVPVESELSGMHMDFGSVYDSFKVDS